MFEVLVGFVTTVVAVGVAGVGYVQSKNFVAKRLRYVDSAQNPGVPIIAGVAAVAVAAPVVAVLPFVGAGTAILFGLSVGFGTRAGVKTFARGLLP